MAKTQSTTLTFKHREISPDDLKIPPHLRAVLWVEAGPARGASVVLAASRTVVGRSEAADVQIEDDALSRRHFEITYRNLEFRIHDLDSSNGTFLNGAEVQEYGLRNGDSIQAGASKFQFRVGRAPS